MSRFSQATGRLFTRALEMGAQAEVGLQSSPHPGAGSIDHDPLVLSADLHQLADFSRVPALDVSPLDHGPLGGGPVHHLVLHDIERNIAWRGPLPARLRL
jgi:hypothetical protein